MQRVEESSPTGWAASLFSSNRAFGPTNEDYLWEIQRKVILELAEKGPCVIVGRCADYILRHTADCLTAFIHASMGIPGKANCGGVRGARTNPGGTDSGKGQTPGGLPSFLHGYEMGVCQELPNFPGQRGVGHCAMRRRPENPLLNPPVRPCPLAFSPKGGYGWVGEAERGCPVRRAIRKEKGRWQEPARQVTPAPIRSGTHFTRSRTARFFPASSAYSTGRYT